MVILGSACLEFSAGALPGIVRKHFVLIYMWWVAASSVLARRLLRQSQCVLSFRWGGQSGTRAFLVATAFPLVVGLTAYGIAWRAGLARFVADGMPAQLFGISISGPPGMRFFKYLLLSLTLGALWSCKSAAGEEIGWRGYMLTRLINSDLPAPLLLSGLIWGLWHVPLILGGQYSAVPRSVLSIVIFVIDIAGAGYIFAWLRLSSGSIWPCVWAHGVWNAVILGPFETTTHAPNWLGEPGLLTTAVVILFAVTLYRFAPLQPRAIRSRVAPTPQQSLPGD